MVSPKVTDQESPYAIATDQPWDFNGYAVTPLPAVDRNELILQGNFQVDPAAGYIVSNRYETAPVIYVPGVLNNQPLLGAQQIANLKGRPVFCVENNTAGLVRDLACCGAFAAHPSIGALTESSSVKSTLEVLDEQIRNNIRPVVYAHSEGNFIVNEALRQEMTLLMSRGYSMDQVRQIMSSIQIYRYGSPENSSAAGSSTVFEHSQDPVSKISYLIDAKNKVINLITGRMRNDDNVIKVKDDASTFPIDIGSHQIISYLENNPEFYDKSRAHVSPQGRAFALCMSIKQGFFSNPEYERIIERMLTSRERSPGDRAQFAQAVLSYAPHARIDNYTFTQQSWDLLIGSAAGN